MPLAESYPFYVANKPRSPNRDLVVTDKYSGKVVTRVAQAGAEDVEAAIAAADAARGAMARLPAHARRDALEHCVRRFRERADELAESLVIEAGKPAKDAHGEVTRLIDTFRIAAEEVSRPGGEVVEMGISERTEAYRGMWKRVPIGPCSFITPFNFPLNLVAHKVAPAIAAGCSFVLKPAEATPVGALLIGEILAETNLPEGAFSILPVPRDRAEQFVSDERLKLLSFTGSDVVGWKLKAAAGKKKVVLELGGNAACLVDADADLGDTLERVLFGGFYQSGQSCISVQRILVHEAVYGRFRDRLVEKVEALVCGDPHDENTYIGPMISEEAAKRLEGWIEAAREAGAKVLCGGKRSGAMLTPAVVENVPTDCELYDKEAFGPVVCLEPYNDFDKALSSVNASRYGLQAGLFVRDIGKINRAWDRLEVGGVVINDVPSFRVDNMPYGGVKDSGIGREGVRYAMDDMSEIRLLVIRSING